MRANRFRPFVTRARIEKALGGGFSPDDAAVRENDEYITMSRYRKKNADSRGRFLKAIKQKSTGVVISGKKWGDIILKIRKMRAGEGP